VDGFDDATTDEGRRPNGNFIREDTCAIEEMDAAGRTKRWPLAIQGGRKSRRMGEQGGQLWNELLEIEVSKIKSNEFPDLGNSSYWGFC